MVAVDAVSGPEVQTEKAWEEADALQLPRLIVLTRMDRDRASLSRSLDALQARFGRTVVLIQLPIGEEKHFTGVVDLVSMKAYTFAGDGSGKMTDTAVPADMASAVTSARDALVNRWQRPTTA